VDDTGQCLLRPEENPGGNYKTIVDPINLEKELSSIAK